jgi:hypothetical protein
LRHKFAAERFGEDALVKMVEQFPSAGRFSCNVIDPSKGKGDCSSV